MTHKRHIGTLIDRKLKAAAILDPKGTKILFRSPCSSSAEKMLLCYGKVALIKIYSSPAGWNPPKNTRNKENLDSIGCKSEFKEFAAASSHMCPSIHVLPL